MPLNSRQCQLSRARDCNLLQPFSLRSSIAPLEFRFSEPIRIRYCVRNVDGKSSNFGGLVSDFVEEDRKRLFVDS
ncbi:hypothetical protein SLE2022_248110 [Rubroshorea leprosula]